ncbi:MAG: TonB-dependent receptor [Proteobacteria bacterium]|nr:TonB-dependent receptor [Pseudomonadota bacterium]MBU1687433.1 TonB-dependent receptor [Pseudomonadota bacterium]
MRSIFPILVLTLLAQTAGAQEVRQELDEVVVTASRVSEKIKDTPVSVSLLTNQELETIKARNPEEFLTTIPGINSQGFGGESELTAIRVPTHFTNPYTIVLVDGVPTASYGSGSSSQFLGINNDNIARIEIIKGPASALYGSNAIGGIINVITKEPSATPQATIRSEIGDYHQVRSSLSGSGGTGRYGFNVDLSQVDSDGWREHSSLEKEAASVKVNYTPNDISLLSFKTDFIRSENDSPGSISEADFKSDWQHSYHSFAYNESDKLAPALTYNLYLDEAEFRATLAMRDVEEKSIPNYSIRQLTYGRQPRPYIGSLNSSDATDFNLQLFYSHNLSLARARINTGLDLVNGTNDSKSYDLAVTMDPITNRYESYTVGDLAKSYDITTTVLAPYLQLEFSPLTRLRLSAGGRYDAATYEVDDRLGGGTGGDKDFSQFSPKAGLTYEISPALNGYLNYSDGFVVPTTSQLWTSRYGNHRLSPEKARNYEIGLRSSFWEKRLRIDCSVYTMDIKDKIVVNDDSTLYINAGKATQRGIEFQATILPIDHVRLNLSYTYAENEYDSYVTGGIDYSGNTQPRSPANHLNARLIIEPLTNLEVELELDTVSHQFADEANLYSYDRPDLFHLRTSYDWRSWSGWVHILNLTDEEYATYVSASTSEDFMSLYSGAPRTFYAGLSYHWGGGSK